MSNIINIDFEDKWESILGLNNIDKLIFEDHLSWLRAKLVFIDNSPAIIGRENGEKLIDLGNLRFSLNLVEESVGFWQIQTVHIRLSENIKPTQLKSIEADMNLIESQVMKCNEMLRSGFFKKEEK